MARQLRTDLHGNEPDGIDPIGFDINGGDRSVSRALDLEVDLVCRHRVEGLALDDDVSNAHKDIDDIDLDG